VTTLLARIRRLAGQDRFEEAGTHRDRMSAFVEAAARTQRLRAISGCPQIVAARRARRRRLGGACDPARPARRRGTHDAR